ncbi:nuclear envelope phosphatase-regulatory subunit 1 homolog isoform X1 [Ceratitis capitata]|uniref:nuclear envelope phosphatase-regulatory subunit 1 homolog isoform X1 n=1 Tax=Ceratitis capitata TaxID=7213 RepID=UPI000A119EEB|nr:nuclear envelope phosphatase-regulatory subunit 1 homolog isoform X1 [Ceratitis capitata]
MEIFDIMEPSACEDLKAFERRLTEVVSSYGPSTLRWRSKNFFCIVNVYLTNICFTVVLATISICTAIGAYYWLRDPRTSIVPLIESLLLHPMFTVATMMLVILFIMGIHKLVFAPKIITTRMRTVLSDFNMSCDDTGKLILKPRPNNNLDGNSR